MSDESPGQRGTPRPPRGRGAPPRGADERPGGDRRRRPEGEARDGAAGHPPGGGTAAASAGAAPGGTPGRVPGAGTAGAAAAGAGRPLAVAGLVAALWCIGIGLAVLTTFTLIGWIAAPKTALGHGMAGVFRTAVNFWLVSNHAGFSGGHGRVGLLPLGVLVLPGALLYRGGGWMIRGMGLPARPRVTVVRVAVALAVPYAGLAGLLALAASSPQVRPSAWQALIACFVVAVVAGGFGAARAVVAAQVAAEARGRRLRSGLGALLRLLPDRPRSLVVGVAGATSVLLASGAVLVGGSLALHMAEGDRLYDMLAPGVVGGVLLLIVELAFLPNAVIWGMAYAVGPGFSVGAGTSVSATGVFLDTVPAFPPLAALPEPGPAPAVSLLALAAPFVAGVVGGVLTIRSLPSPVHEAAPLWGAVSGVLTGAVAALLTALSGGPLGGGRMATVGPSAWQVGLMAALEVGIAAAIAAWAANWAVLRRDGEAERPVSRRARRRERRNALRDERRRERAQARRREQAHEQAHDKGRERTRDQGREQTRGTGRAPRPAAAEAPLPGPVPAEPLAAPVPGAEPEARPASTASPYAPGPLEFEEAEPVLAPRRSRARTRPDDPQPGLADDPPVPHEEEVVLDAPGADDAGPVPPPRGDAERTENRGGAIYVLRDEPRQD